MRTKRVRRLKKRRRTSRRLVGGEALPPKNELTIEFVYNDYFRTKEDSLYPTDIIIDETPLTKLKAFAEQRGMFGFKSPSFDGIKLTLNPTLRAEQILGTPPDTFTTQINQALQQGVCKGVATLRDLTVRTFTSSMYPLFCALLRYNGAIIGLCMFSIHPSSIKIEWLCGSKYNGVGTLLINLMKKLREHFGTESITLDSLSRAVPFYTKLGFVSTEETCTANTCTMEFRPPKQ